MSPDLTITSAHRETLRRIGSGERLTLGLADRLGDLYLHELVDDVEGLPALTALGRRVLDEGARMTVRTERPRLVSQPLPSGWRRWECSPERCIAIDYGAHVIVLAHDDDAETVRVVERLGRELVAGVDWLRHEQAVRAQDGAS